jgi:hypothetical protein
MYGISSEDRLWLVKRDQEERRSYATGTRMASEASRRRSIQAANAPKLGARRTLRPAWASPAHFLHAFTGMRGAVRHGPTR